MTVQALQLEGVRNLAPLVLEPGTQLNVIYGENGQGKTSLLEGIYYLANLKSFRTSRQTDLIQDGRTEAVLRARVRLVATVHRLELCLSATGRKKRLDGKIPRSNSAIYELLRPVLFAPDHVGVVQGGPAPRRDLLDRAIFTASPAYLAQVLEYGRIVRQRNRLLKEEQFSLLEPWDQALVEQGARLRRQRNDYVNFIRPLFQEAYRDIADGREGADLGGRQQADLSLWQTELQQQLQAVAAQERRLKSSLVGPHRDDLDILIDGKPARRYASQGQQRSLVLAFKMAQTRLLEQQTGQAPVLLLDDMTSELDARRERTLIRFLVESGGQVFITTTQKELFDSIEPSRIRFFRMEKGALISE